MQKITRQYKGWSSDSSTEPADLPGFPRILRENSTLSLPNTALPSTGGLANPGTALTNAYKAGTIYSLMMQIGMAQFSGPLDRALRPRLAEVSRLDVGLQRRARIAHLLDHMLRRLRPEPLGFQVCVCVLAQVVLTRHTMGERHWETQHARSLTVCRVADSAAAWSDSGISFTRSPPTPGPPA